MILKLCQSGKILQNLVTLTALVSSYNNIFRNAFRQWNNKDMILI